MFGDLNFWQMFLKGGVVVFVLLAISILSWWIIIERIIRFVQMNTDTKEFMEKIKKLVQKKDFDGAIMFAESTPGPVPAVILAGLKNKDLDRVKLEAAMQRELNFESERMQRYLDILGTIGNVTPFIGLFGTVLGIIRAFHDLSLATGGGPSVVANGIAEALVATAMGLFVAVPAVIAYNLFVKKIDTIETECINASSELADVIEEV
ncbi:MAG: MotA/TolQ/ExbB proton channel family protein [Candidatus Goldbacteria bacterium]|nr:MotA/TolQ/ExbB proton channel family protein [Candidatus Goldiibacteriota bacterium]HPD18373.1 MotA/TolQ/ExbB proton channel family protein [Candidatus Goldiibacteriota bacterium]